MESVNEIIEKFKKSNLGKELYDKLIWFCVCPVSLNMRNRAIKENKVMPGFLQSTPSKISIYLMAKLGCGRDQAYKSAAKVQELFGDDFVVDIVPVENRVIKTEGFYIEIPR